MRLRKLLLVGAALAALCVGDMAPAQMMTLGVGTGGTGAGSGGGGGFAFTYQTTVAAAVGFASSWTFTSVPIGTAASDRIVDIAFASDFEASPGFTAPTICGVTGTLARNDGAATVKTANYYANVPTGTTCSIVIHGASISGLIMSVWTMTGQTGGATATPTSTAYGTSASADPPGVSLAITVSTSGKAAVFAAGNGAAGVSPTCTWTNAALGGGGGPVGGNNEVGCSGTASASATVTVASGSGTAFASGAPIVSVSWGP